MVRFRKWAAGPRGIPSSWTARESRAPSCSLGHSTRRQNLPDRNGVVLDPGRVRGRTRTLIGQGVDVSPNRLKISSKTHLIMPYRCWTRPARTSEGQKGRDRGTTGRTASVLKTGGPLGVRAPRIWPIPTCSAKIAAALKEKNVLFTALWHRRLLAVDVPFDEVMAVAPPSSRI